MVKPLLCSFINMQSLVGDEIAVVPSEVGCDVVAAGDEQGVGAGVQRVGVVEVVPRQVPPILGHLVNTRIKTKRARIYLMKDIGCSDTCLCIGNLERYHFWQ